MYKVDNIIKGNSIISPIEKKEYEAWHSYLKVEKKKNNVSFLKALYENSQLSQNGWEKSLRPLYPVSNYSDLDSAKR